MSKTVFLLFSLLLITRCQQNPWLAEKKKESLTVIPLKIEEKSGILRENFLVYYTLRNSVLFRARVKLGKEEEIRLYDENYQPVPLGLLEKSTYQTVFCFKINLLPFQKKRYYLTVEKKGKAGRGEVGFDEKDLTPAEGKDGVGIEYWRKEIATKDRHVNPAYGQYFYKITVKTTSKKGDHFNNCGIKYKTGLHLLIGENTFLEYDIRYEKLSSMKITVQGMMSDGTPTWENSALDQHFLPAKWTADLKGRPFKKWYHRRIPLKSFRGKELTELFFMANDTSESVGEETVVYFDNIRITEGEPPQITLPLSLKIKIILLGDLKFTVIYLILLTATLFLIITLTREKE
jgi:hypothetical protein